MSEVKYGVYVCLNGALKVLEPPTEKDPRSMSLDEGRVAKGTCGPITISVPIVKRMSLGWPVFETRGELKDAEYLGEL